MPVRIHNRKDKDIYMLHLLTIMHITTYNKQTTTTKTDCNSILERNNVMLLHTCIIIVCYLLSLIL